MRLFIIILSFICVSVIAGNVDRISLAKQEKFNHAYPGTEDLEIYKEYHLKTQLLGIADKIYIASEDEVEFEEILNELELNKNKLKMLQIEEFPQKIFYDITDGAIPSKAKDLFGLEAIFDNARCYSIVHYYKDYIGAITDSSEQSFKVFVKSPLVKEVSEDEFAPGDIIALDESAGADVPTDHVAILLTPHLYFHKAGSISEFKIDILAKSSFEENYNEKYYKTRKYYRMVKNLDEYFQENMDLISLEEKLMLENLEKFEGNAQKYILTSQDSPYYPGDEDEEAWTEAFYTSHKKIKKTLIEYISFAQAKLQELTNINLNKSDREFLEFLYKFIITRSEDIAYINDPYSD